MAAMRQVVRWPCRDSATMTDAARTQPPSPHPEPEESHVSFDALIEKVRQAEIALEAKERQTTANWRQAKGSWRAAWTPGRIVFAGLATGFLFGRAEPFKRAAGGGAMQLISALGSLIAGENARKAADKADDAADAVQDATGAVPDGAAAVATARAVDPAADEDHSDATPYRDPSQRSRSAEARPHLGGVDPEELPESLRDRGRL